MKIDKHNKDKYDYTNRDKYRSRNEFKTKHHSSEKPDHKICHHYLKGKCTYGNRCRFSHAGNKKLNKSRSSRESSEESKHE